MEEDQASSKEDAGMQRRMVLSLLGIIEHELDATLDNEASQFWITHKMLDYIPNVQISR